MILFLMTILDLGANDVPAFAAVKAVYGTSLDALTVGSKTLHAAASKGYIVYERNTDRVYLTAAGRAQI
jgi:hypothetical protein